MEFSKWPDMKTTSDSSPLVMVGWRFWVLMTSVAAWFSSLVWSMTDLKDIPNFFRNEIFGTNLAFELWRPSTCWPDKWDGWSKGWRVYTNKQLPPIGRECFLLWLYDFFISAESKDPAGTFVLSGRNIFSIWRETCNRQYLQYSSLSVRTNWNSFSCIFAILFAANAQGSDPGSEIFEIPSN